MNTTSQEYGYTLHTQPDNTYYHLNQHQTPTQGQMIPGNMAGGQPMPGGVGQPNACVWEPSIYHAKLCGCFDDCNICLMSFFCPCTQFGRNYQQLHGGEEEVYQQGLLYLKIAHSAHVGLRKEMRKKFNIQGTEREDFWVTFLCSCCALAQEAREIEWRKQEAARKGIPFN